MIMNEPPQLWSVLEALPDAVVVVDRGGLIILANAQTETTFGYRREELIGQPVECLLPKRYRGNHVKRRAEFVADPHGRPMDTGLELYARRKDGSEFPVNINLSPLNAEKGQPVISVIRDVTTRARQDIIERKQAERTLSRRLEELTVLHAIAVIEAKATNEDTLIERATEIIGEMLYPDNFGVLLLDETAGVLRPHPSYRGLPESARGLAIPLGNGIVGGVAACGRPRRICDTTEEPAYLAVVSAMRSELCVPLILGIKEPAAAPEGQPAFALPRGRVIGVVNAERAQLHAFSENDERLMVTFAGQLAAAIEKVRLFAETRRLAIADTVTGLYNRRHFFELAGHEYERMRRYGRPLSAIMLDIDHFKQINDTYGHAAGDQVLRAVAALCRESLRGVDVVDRYGGEEFAFLLPESNLTDTRIVAERLCQRATQEAFATDRGAVAVSISLGVASLDNSCSGLESLLERANRALYAAKQAGRNQVCVAEESLVCEAVV